MTQPSAPRTSLRALGRTVLDVLRTRVELLALELAEERTRIAQLALYGAVAVMSLCLTLQSLAVLALAWYWDTPFRIAVAAGVMAFFVAQCALCVWILAARLRSKAGAFDGTIRALADDVQALV